MANRAQRIRDLLTSRHLRQAEIAPRPDENSGLWIRSNLAGRLVEISATGASASLTAAMGLVREAQREGEPVAWISLPETCFYPPDAAASGVDLAALAVVRAPDGRLCARAADRLLRSGAFGLVVLDLGDQSHGISMAQQGRLVGLAQKHDAAVVCLTQTASESPSMGSMVSLRVEVARQPTAEAGRFACRLTALKDKQRGPRWQHVEVVRGPAGLR